MATMEQVLHDNANWLNCTKGLPELAAGLSDLALCRGTYSTSERECRLRLESLQKRWATSCERLKHWLSGESASRLSQREQKSTGQETGEHKSDYRAVVDIDPERYMPNDQWLAVERNGIGDWEGPMAPENAINPVININERLVRRGLAGKDAEEDLFKDNSTAAIAAQERRREKAEAEERKVAEGSRQKLSLFS